MYDFKLSLQVEAFFSKRTSHLLCPVKKAVPKVQAKREEATERKNSCVKI